MAEAGRLAVASRQAGGSKDGSEADRQNQVRIRSRYEVRRKNDLVVANGVIGRRLIGEETRLAPATHNRVAEEELVVPIEEGAVDLAGINVAAHR
mmetsp:Transcript_23501/g.35720  ORF Transcript_23501/g.35720 Transcript_23501/m.35720 type:complete len:95 (-) Transcript_23501:29-313(-)